MIKKKSQVLKGVRKIIETGEEAAICGAIWRMCWRGFIPLEMKDYLQDWIMLQLGQDATYGGWLLRHYPEIVSNAERHGMSRLEIHRQGRLAWLDYLIARQIKHENKGKK